MKRRTLLSAGVATTISISGCVERIPLIGTSPVDLVEDFYSNAFSGDREGANNLIHEDSISGQLSEEDVNDFQELNYQLASAELIGRSDEDTLEITDVAAPGEDEDDEGEQNPDGLEDEEFDFDAVERVAQVEANLEFEFSGDELESTNIISTIDTGDGWMIWDY